MPSSRVTLFIPDLFWPEPGDELAWGAQSPALSRLLARAHFQRLPRQSPETTLASLFAPETPLARMRRRGEADAADATETDPESAMLFCADPVQLVFSHERILLGQTGFDDLSPADAVCLCARLNAAFPDFGHFSAPHPLRWYLTAAPGFSLPPTAPLSDAIGRELGSLLRDANPLFARRLNEIQMALHADPLNRARREQGQTPIGGLWFWGGEHSPRFTALPLPPVDRAFGAAPLLAGLARACKIPLTPLPAAAPEIAPGHTLILLPQLESAALTEDAETWAAALATLDAAWLAPLQARLGRALARLDLICPTAYGLLTFSLGQRQNWRFWRRPLALRQSFLRLKLTTPIIL